MKVYHFGAGNIGKGLLAELFYLNNLPIIFIDINKNNIDENNNFFVKKINANQIQKYHCANFYNSIFEQNELIEKLKEADYITTAIGPNNLEKIIPILISAILKRTKKQPLIIAAMENKYRASSSLVFMLQQKIPKELYNRFFAIDLVVDRIVPEQMNKDFLLVDDYYEVVYEKKEHLLCFKNNMNVKGVLNYDQYFLRKFYGVNGLHFILAFLSKKNNYQYVHQILNDEKNKKLIKNLINELTEAISALTQIAFDDIKQYLHSNILRFSNSLLKDENSRILRNLKIKLEKNERIYPLFAYFNKKNINNELTKIYQEMKEII